MKGRNNPSRQDCHGPVLAILGFHKVGRPPDGRDPTWFYIPGDVFAAQLAYLKEHDWVVLDLAAFLEGLSCPRSLPKRAALLTFDDGSRSVLDVALPLLKRFRYPAVLFVPTDFVGGVNSFDEGLEPTDRICGWIELRALNEGGVLVESHGVSHRRFSDLTMAEQERELRQSKALLEEKLGRSVETFAYPYGDHGGNLGGLRRILTAAGYRAACLFGGGPNQLPVPDPFLLSRVAMGPDTDLDAELSLVGVPLKRDAP